MVGDDAHVVHLDSGTAEDAQIVNREKAMMNTTRCINIVCSSIDSYLFNQVNTAHGNCDVVRVYQHIPHI